MQEQNEVLSYYVLHWLMIIWNHNNLETVVICDQEQLQRHLQMYFLKKKKKSDMKFS